MSSEPCKTCNYYLDMANVQCRTHGLVNARKDETDMENVMLRKQVTVLLECVKRCLYGHVIDAEGNRDEDGYTAFPDHKGIEACLRTTLVQVKQQSDYYRPKLDKLAAVSLKHQKRLKKLCQPNKKNSD
jgi:hypothetical protein